MLSSRISSTRCGPGPNQDQILSLQARLGRGRSRTWLVRVGQSRSLPGQCSNDLDRSRAYEGRRWTGRVRVGRSGSLDRSSRQTNNRVVKLSLGRAGSGPTAIPVLRGRVRTAVRQESTSTTALMLHRQAHQFLFKMLWKFNGDNVAEIVLVWNTSAKLSSEIIPARNVWSLNPWHFDS
jgi:hypothetical protein